MRWVYHIDKFKGIELFEQIEAAATARIRKDEVNENMGTGKSLLPEAGGCTENRNGSGNRNFR